MNRIAIVITVLVLFAALNRPLPAAQNVAAPRITAGELSFDFGDVVQGTEASHTFEFRNEGNAELVIESVQPS